MCGVMTETAQQSQAKCASDSPAIFAFAIRRHDYFNVYAEFFAYSARFNYSFSKREIQKTVEQIDSAIANGEFYFCANGKKYAMPATLMQELRNSLISHVVSNGGSDAQVSDRGLDGIPAARHSAKTQASAQGNPGSPARQISTKKSRRNRRRRMRKSFLEEERPADSALSAIHTKNGRTSVVIGTRKL